MGSISTYAERRQEQMARTVMTAVGFVFVAFVAWGFGYYTGSLDAATMEYGRKMAQHTLERQEIGE